ncbi:MAG: MATE family efflux transporter [SAR86 cluster bacterium]|uniref:Multidrug-efflux transporter n=1 Tax=SAR86 cluster bacterium TaxID=2030880 RepID=A0A2A4MFA2_9GAMM|nr:MAG: MATE family efflux transporter [SAR86 cluster bacterium]
MVISQGAFAVMIFTDRYFMSQISSTHIAASLGGGVASFFSFCFFTGLLSYANALAAQYFGAGEKSKCSIVLTQGLIITVLSIPLLVLISFLVVGIFSRMGHDPQMEALESTYYLILMAGSVITLAKICLSSYFAGIGRTSVVMVCDVLGLILNIPLCYVMVFGKLGFPALGIVGAGISTIVATAFSLLLFFAYYLAKKNRIEFSVMSSFVFHRQIFRRFLRLGFPSGMEIFLNVAAFNLFLLMFQSYGIAQAASAAIVFNWDILSFVPMMGLNIGVISLIGRFVGAGNMEKTDEVISAGFVLGLGYAAVLASIFIVFRFQLVDVFAPPVGDFTATRALSAFMMIGLSCYVTADAIILVAGGVLRGAGDTKWLMYSSTLLHWLMLAAQYVIIMVLQLGPKASWWAFVVMIITIAVVFVWRLQGGRWRDPKVLARVMAN